MSVIYLAFCQKTVHVLSPNHITHSSEADNLVLYSFMSLGDSCAVQIPPLAISKFYILFMLISIVLHMAASVVFVGSRTAVPTS